jgi:hypothetical protein
MKANSNNSQTHPGFRSQTQPITLNEICLADAKQTLLNDIVEKQYRLYSWNDQKTIGLVTANSLLIACIGFLFKETISDVLSHCLLMLALLCVSISLLLCLRQIIPQGSSGQSGSETNVRSLRWILECPNYVEYMNEISKITKREILNQTARQAFGMARVNDNSRKITKKASFFTMGGLFFIFLGSIATSISAYEVNILGKWAPDRIQPVRITNMPSFPIPVAPNPERTATPELCPQPQKKLTTEPMPCSALPPLPSPAE